MDEKTDVAPAMQAAERLYHAYFTGLILTLVTRRSPADAAEWVFRVFRHVHDRHLALQVIARRDWGDDAYAWRIRPRALTGFVCQ